MRRHPIVRAACVVVALMLPWGAARAVTIKDVHTPGGLDAWLVEDHSLPVVTVDVAFRGGAALDPADKEGLANLVCDLLDEGAGDLDSSAYQGKLEDMASALDFDAGEDEISISLHSVTANLEPSLALLKLALTKPRFDASAVARVKGQLAASLERDQHQPRAIADRAWRTAMFGDHPYARRLRGTPESIAGIGPDDMRAFVRDRFAKDALMIAVVGDIAPDRLARLLDDTLGPLPDHAAAGQTAPLVVRDKGEVLLNRMAIPQSVVEFGQPGIKRDDPDWYAALLVTEILGGGGLTARLSEEVREKRGLAYSVYAGLDPMQDGGVIAGGVGTENASLGQSIALIRGEWKRMHDAGPTAEELAHAKTYLTGSFPLSLDSTGRIAGILIAMERDRLGIDYLNRRDKLIDGVSLADAKRVARRLLDPAALTFVVVGSPPDLPGAIELKPGGS
ncbi:MAG TPA: pitrilysin family protein [Stellaceae bacterium]|nr:pitrilysin family protein [Stellaceae bacterium]